MQRIILLLMLAQAPLLASSIPLLSNSTTTLPSPLSTTQSTCAGSAPPTNVPSTTFPVTVPAQPGGTSGPVIGQPAWDYTNLNQTNNGPLHLSVSTTGGNKSSLLLYGVMLEDIDHSIDGGLYAETIQNRAFQDRTMEGWYAVNGACMGLTTELPLSDALPNSLRVEMKGPGEGFANEGWWGLSVRPVAYNISFWARTSSDVKNFTVKTALISAADQSHEWVSTEVALAGGPDWTYYTATLTPAIAAPDTNNLFVITSTSSQSATVQFNLISLFPPTYNNRTNGVRPDLMQNLLDLNLKHCRIPGGNNLEGQTVARRWKWNETIGPLTTRPGRPGDWGYYNTDGMGLFEWLTFCEDLVGADGGTILGVYAGYSLGGESVPEEALQPFIDDILRELEYVLGAPDSAYGSLRVRDGRTSPWNVQYIEIGNEDWFSNTYAYRWPAFYQALKATYPDKTFIATTTKGIQLPAGVQFDQHFYGDSRNFLGLFSAWDTWPRDNGTDVIVSEYSVQRFDNQTFSPWPFMQASVAEAVMGLGIERNSDVVKTQMYAPFLSNLHYDREGKPRLISFDADPAQTVLSSSYWVLKLLASTHPADARVLEVEGSVPVHPLYWTASLDVGTAAVYVKVANAGEGEQVVSTNLQCGTASVVEGEKLARNTPEEKGTVGIEELEVGTGEDGGSRVTMPGWSVAVLTCGE